jgi:hypothetical protein
VLGHQALEGFTRVLPSRASARSNLTAGRSRAADGSGERHDRSIRVRGKPHRDTLRHQLNRRFIAVRVRPPGYWHRSSDCRSDAANHPACLYARLP